MKKMLLMGILFASIPLFSQVGINTNLPASTLDIAGFPTSNTVLDGVIPPRLTGDQLGSKIYTVNQRGAIVYVTTDKVSSTNPQVAYVNAPGLYQFDGSLWILTVGKLNLFYGTLGAGASGRVNASQYTGGSIELPTGKWLVYSQMLVKMVTNPNTGVSYWVRSTFSNSATSGTPSTDIIGSRLISASIVGPSTYSMMNGAIRINNTSASPKIYYYWKDGGGVEAGGTSNTDQFGANTSIWGENIIYAIPYVD